MSDWLDTLGLSDVDSVDESDKISARVDMTMWDAEKYENKICIRFTTKSEKTTLLEWPRLVPKALR